VTPHGLRVASAPVTWGVWREDRAPSIPKEALVELVGELGFAGVELGPPGYLGETAPATRELLDGHGLQAAGVYVELSLFAADASASASVEALADVARAVAPLDAPVVLADAGSSARVRAAGRPDELAAMQPSAAAFSAAVERLRRAVDAARAHGVDVAVHPHAGTHFETAAEIRDLLDATQADDIGICLDTGHAIVGGLEPTELAELCGGRLRHLHLKDVDGRTLELLRAGRLDYDGAWQAGLWCPLGDGLVDFAAFARVPAVASYAGWIVLEQDRYAVALGDVPAVVHDERRSLAFAHRLAIGAAAARHSQTEGFA